MHLMAGFQSVTRIHVLICILCVCLTYVFYIQACELVLLRALIKSFSLEICSCAHIVDLCEHVGNIHPVMHTLVNTTLHHVTVMHSNTKQHNEHCILSAATSGAVAALTGSALYTTYSIYSLYKREGEKRTDNMFGLDSNQNLTLFCCTNLMTDLSDAYSMLTLIFLEWNLINSL